MNTNLKWKWIFIFAVLLICVYGIIGIPKSKDELIANWKKNIHLGLDLRGGSQLVLQIQVQDAFKAEADSAIDRMKDDLRKAGIDYASIDRNDPQTIADAGTIQINLKGVPADKAGTFRNLVTDRFSTWVLTTVNSSDYRLNLRPTEDLALRKDTVERAMQTIENRINGLGLTESTVQQRGRSDADAEILIQMPGVDDPAHVKAILQTAAMLEIVEVKDGPFDSPEAARAKHGGVLPLNTQLRKMPARPDRGESHESWYLVSRTPVVTGRDVRNARAGRDEMQKWETDFTLSQDGAKRFARFTEANIGNRLAVVLDNQIRSVATIQSRIEDSGRITGQANEQESSDLALVLRAGSLPAGIVYLEERTVGPSLGADSIRDGIIAGIVGVLVVIIAMLVYYRRSGVNATVALVLNALLLIAALSYLNAVLTLPGIAGVILTIGMAVDSNVLIFERIREELRNGKGVFAALDTGFSKALVTIIDTHITTVVSCAFLFLFGTGPVKGFAVTLVIGLVANLFTAVYVSRAIFDWELSGKRQVTSLSI
ncbi:MAG: protein translocase subunit SecD [Bryobacterales bacterium]|nr:protein translocase subunit SecD [Bryobacterales bacterium]